ncbi:hypothetical protein AHAS_Ahas13G0335600 [Arachis hypogaea]
MNIGTTTITIDEMWGLYVGLRLATELDIQKLQVDGLLLCHPTYPRCLLADPFFFFPNSSCQNRFRWSTHL